MTDIALPTHGSSSLRTMAGIEARRLLRHPAFVVGVVLAFGVLGLMFALDDRPNFVDLLSMPVIPAFFIGLPSLLATARLTRSTDTTAEAIGTAPGTEADRTRALVVACLVPFAAGALWVAVQLAMVAARPAHANEWWFGTMPDWQVWSILVALGPVACFGGALLGVLTGRWLRFPGAAAVVVVALVVIDMVGQLPIAYGDSSELRLWVPWAMFHSGSDTDGTQSLLAGNPGFYLVYLLCLCALAALVAVWHDRTARHARMRAAVIGVAVLAVLSLALAITTGSDDNRVSDPIPFQVQE